MVNLLLQLWHKIDDLTPGETPLSSKARTRTRTRTHTGSEIHARSRLIGVGTGRQKKVSIYHQLVPSWTLCASTSAASIGARLLRRRARADACGSLSAPSSLRQPPYSRDPCKFIMQNANIAVRLFITIVRFARSDIHISSLKNTWMCLLLRKKNILAHFLDKVFQEIITVKHQNGTRGAIDAV